jgi:hypothetical protein
MLSTALNIKALQIKLNNKFFYLLSSHYDEAINKYINFNDNDGLNFQYVLCY